MQAEIFLESFQNIMFFPGDWHTGMNVLQSIFKVFWRIHLFCHEGHISNTDYCVLVTTNAASVGIDKSFIALQL